MLLREMTDPAFAHSFKRFAQCVVVGLALTGLAACGGGDPKPTPTPTPTPTPAPAPDPTPTPTPDPATPPPQMNIMPPNQPTLPPVLTPSSPPQASGTDISTIEISGLGSLSRFAVSNSGRTTAVIAASSWYEPKDGSYQRMMVTRETSVPPGQVVEVPIACMQRSKSVPANGLRFFSRPKAVTGSVQGCQRNCLSGAEAGIQSCIWGCETPTRNSPTPTRNSITWQITDTCNDRRRVEFRFFEQNADSLRLTSRSWPGGTRFWFTPGVNRSVTQPLACQAGTNVCYGARVDGNTRSYWGAGFEGNQRCTNCCYACGDSPRPLRIGCPR